MANLPSCNSIADYFLLHVQQENGDTLSNLKLQKLCFYAQAWHLAIHKKPLFSERIEAWAHGPVVPALYRRFRNCGLGGAIDAFSIVSNPTEDLHADHLGFLEEIWARYGGLSGTQLEALTHSEDPWRLAYGDRPMGSRCENEITQASMKKYYGSLLAA